MYVTPPAASSYYRGIPAGMHSFEAGRTTNYPITARTIICNVLCAFNICCCIHTSLEGTAARRLVAWSLHEAAGLVSKFSKLVRPSSTILTHIEHCFPEIARCQHPSYRCEHGSFVVVRMWALRTEGSVGSCVSADTAPFIASMRCILIHPIIAPLPVLLLPRSEVRPILLACCPPPQRHHHCRRGIEWIVGSDGGGFPTSERRRRDEGGGGGASRFQFVVTAIFKTRHGGSHGRI